MGVSAGTRRDDLPSQPSGVTPIDSLKRQRLAERTLSKAASLHLEGKLESVLKAKRLSTAQREQTPMQYREMVKEYYERLAKE